MRLALAGAVLLLGIGTFAACGGCGRRAEGKSGDIPAAGRASGDAVLAADAPDAATLRDPLLWGNAKEGDVEDLATLAVHEGAMGLVEASSEPALRKAALRAMGYARGWAQLPFLARVASDKDDAEAAVALDAAIELAARPRRSEDPEDSDELKEGCEALGGLARDAKRPRPRRIAAIRALRMLPCPKMELPTDLDAK